MEKKELKIETILAHAGTHWDDTTGAVSMPLYQSAVYRHPALGQSTGYDYTRSANPTRDALENVLAEMDNGASASVFGSGLAAIDAVLRLFKAGDTIIVTEDLYGGTYRLFDKIYKTYGINAVYVDTSDNGAVEKAFETKPAAIFVELPTNPLLKVVDLPFINAIAKRAGALFIVDNTFLTSFNLKALDLGADIVLYSATKYMGGHNDLLMGAVVTATPALGDRVRFIQNAAGAVPGPFDCWLLLRSLKTLAVRLERQEENALRIAQFLEAHPAVLEVYYPGLEGNGEFERLHRQSRGFGAMVSFRLKDPLLVPHILENIKVFLFAESLGGAESLITYPLVQTHADMEKEILERTGITDNLLRMSVGLENIEDLLDDLKQVLTRSA